MKKLVLTVLFLILNVSSFANDTYSAMTPDQVRTQITPNAGPRVQGLINVITTAEFIWWKTRQDGMAFALSGMSNPVSNPTRGNVHQMDFHFEPGFKAGLGFTFDRDGWDVYARYTYLNDNRVRSTTDATDGASTTLAPYWFIIQQDGSPLSTSDRLTFAKGSWGLRFNVIDLELGRNFYISQYLTLRPHIGLKGTWQDQSYIVNYKQILPSINFLRMGMHQDLAGVGIRAGLNSAWFLSRNWSIYGDIALTALWSDFEIKRRDRARIPLALKEQITLNTKNSYHSIKPASELSLGLRYQTYFYSDQFHFLCQVGWEEQIWWSQNQFIRLFEESAHGDLIFHGLTIKFRLDF